MKKYGYHEPGRNGKDHFIIMTEEKILDTYWEWWVRKMKKKYGEGHERITKENCIRDFVVTHWAEEL